jgi:CRP-like cAMP-binding protein
MKTNNVQAAWRGLAACEKCGIRHLALFSDLKEEDFVHIHIPIDDLGFDPGSVLYRVGDTGKAVFTVRSGLVKLTQYLPNGDQRIVRLLRQGDVAGLEALLGQPYQHTAVTLQRTSVCRIPSDVIHRINEKSPRLHRQLMVRWQQSVQKADDWLTKLSTGSARARVARLFLDLMDEQEEPLCQLFGREEVAAMLGITVETASRMIAQFRRDGVIEQLRANHFRCDRDALEDIASDER